MIKIKSKKPGFRRCGIAHPSEWTEYPDGRFTKKELARLKDEPMLTVMVVKDEPEALAVPGEAKTTEANPEAVKKTQKAKS